MEILQILKSCLRLGKVLGQVFMVFRISKITACLLILITFCWTCFAQRNDAQELWRIRSQTITDDLLNDARQLPPLRRAVLWGRLAQSWWRDDSRRAAGWLGNAIEIVEQVPNKESDDERRQRLETARLLLKIAAPLDQKLGKRLISLLNDKDLNDTDRVGNADGLANAAVLIAEHDPKRAAELGLQSLRLGPPTDIERLFWALRVKDGQLAWSFLGQVMGAARQNSSAQLLDALSYIMFPRQRNSGGYESAVTDNLRAELLELDIAFLNANDNQRTASGCANILGFIAPVLSEFDRLVPQHAAVARQAVNRCRGMIPQPQQELQDLSTGATSNSVEELLKAAADAKELPYRTIFEYRAAALARQNKDYERALQILDGMSKESREFMTGSWETYRWDWAAQGALNHYTNGRLLEMNRILAAVPPDWQPFAKTAFVDRLPDRRNAETDPALQFINEARAELRKSNLPDSDKYGCHFVLLRQILKYDAPAASSALKEAIASLNRAEQDTQIKNQKTLDTAALSKTLPAALLEMDEFAVKEGLSSIASVETRAQLRLDLLEATLQRMQKTP
jgi:hypothetical protein